MWRLLLPFLLACRGTGPAAEGSASARAAAEVGEVGRLAGEVATLAGEIEARAEPGERPAPLTPEEVAEIRARTLLLRTRMEEIQAHLDALEAGFGRGAAGAAEAPVEDQVPR